MSEITMHVFGVLSVVSGLGVMLSESSIGSALSLILVFINVCGVLVTVGLETVGILLVIIYVGAVAILFMFVIMMVGENEDRARNRTWIKYWMTLGVLLMTSGIKVTERNDDTGMELINLVDKTSNVKVLGEYLFTEGLISVILVGILLLVGIIGGVSLGK